MLGNDSGACYIQHSATWKHENQVKWPRCNEHHVNCIVSLSKMKPPTTILLHVDWKVAVLMLAVDNGASLGLFFNWKVEVHPFNRFISCTLTNFLGVRKTEAYCLRLLTFFIQQTSILYHLECPLHLLHTFQLLSCLNMSLARWQIWQDVFFVGEILPFFSWNVSLFLFCDCIFSLSTLVESFTGV